MKTTTILKALNFLAWIAYIGYAIEAGAILVSYLLSCANPAAAQNFYNGLNLYELRQSNFVGYTQFALFYFAISVLKSFLWSLAIKVLSKISLSNPFTPQVAATLERIAYVVFAIWVLVFSINGYGEWLRKSGSILLQKGPDSGEYLLMAGLVYLISQVFKRGIELQAENDLTI